MIKRQKIIAVIGGRECDATLYRIAQEVGRRIAEGGAILICGGRDGVMEAACRGAAEVNGISVGILPGDNIADANAYVTIPVATGVGLARNFIIVRSAAAAIAIGGQYGTLSEIAYCLQLGVPVFSLRSWDIKGVIPVETPEQAVDLALQEQDVDSC
jgi:uncharacterized protein (TIGR00725 family)